MKGAASTPGSPSRATYSNRRVERGQGAGDVGEVQASASGALVRVVHRVRAPPHPVLEHLEVVDEVLVVLDDVAAAARERARHLHEAGHGNAPRLERGGEQGAPVHAGERPHAGHAVPGAVESGEHVLGEREIHEPHPGHHRDVAEHEVDERRHAARLRRPTGRSSTGHARRRPRRRRCRFLRPPRRRPAAGRRRPPATAAPPPTAPGRWRRRGRPGRYRWRGDRRWRRFGRRSSQRVWTWRSRFATGKAMVLAAIRCRTSVAARQLLTLTACRLRQNRWIPASSGMTGE